jgi:hypothetical protein
MSFPNDPTPWEIDLDALRALPPAERREAEAQAAAFKELVEANPLWRYVPHEGEVGWKIQAGLPLTGDESRGQVAFHELDCWIGAAVTGNRFGKTTAALADNLIQTLEEEWLPPWLRRFKRWHGEFFCRLVVVDLPTITRVIFPSLRKLAPPEAFYKGSLDAAHTERIHRIQFANGNYWDLLSHDMDVDSFAGAALHRVHFDEEPPGQKGRAQVEESLTRLIDYGGDCRVTMTPLLGFGALWRELTDHGEYRWDDEVKVITGSIDHNPHLSEKNKSRQIRRWSKDPLEEAARRFGRFTHFAGMIYPEFTEDVHVRPATEIPRDENGKPTVPIYAGIDPGLDHPTGVVFAFLAKDDTLTVFDSFKVPGTVADVSTRFHQKLEDHRLRPRWTIIDPSAKNRHHISGRSIQQEYMEHGIVTLPGQNSRLAGFNRVKERLNTNRLVLFAGQDELVEEFKQYRWKSARSGSEEASPQEPVKINDDLLDALRYLVMQLPQFREPKDEEVPDEHPGMRAFREQMQRQSHSRGHRRIGGAIPV